VRLELWRGGSISGVVIDEAGVPVTRYTLVVVPPGKPGESEDTRFRRATDFESRPLTIDDAGGAFQVKDLAAGSYDLVATAAGGGVALVAGLLAWAFGKVHPDLSREVVVLSGVIALVPGMTLTTGLAELAQKSLVAGAARLMEAFAAFLAILLGIALAVGLQARLGAPAPPSPLPQALPLPFQAVALVAAALAFAVIFAMPRSHMGAAVASGAIGYLATAFGGRYVPAHASAFGAALAICLFSNGLARLTQRPAQLFQLPGMMLLVPGSFGFLSLENFLRGDFLNGAARGFEMLLMGGALVTGVLLANVVLPAKKLL
jgi:uncharacterized membrane protein YjjB (DUF3815 family)